MKFLVLIALAALAAGCASAPKTPALFAVVPGASPFDLVGQVRALASQGGAEGANAHLRFRTDQRLRLAIDGAAPVAVEPDDERELAPGRHRLVFEWPSGARDVVELELGAGERRSVRPELPPAKKPDTH